MMARTGEGFRPGKSHIEAAHTYIKTNTNFCLKDLVIKTPDALSHLQMCMTDLPYELSSSRNQFSVSSVLAQYTKSLKITADIEVSTEK